MAHRSAFPSAVHDGHRCLGIFRLFALILSILISMQWCLIHVFLMTTAVEHDVPLRYLNFSCNVHVFVFVCLLHVSCNSLKKHCGWSSKHGSHTSSSSITWKLRESADCQVPPKPSEAETLGVGLDLTSPPGDSLVWQILRTVASQ